MITDEQIWQIAKKYLCNVGSHYINEMAMPDDGRIEEFARELIALAQQVKPLAFVKTGDYDNSTPPVEHYSATTEFGNIELITGVGND